jgi:hypothetical protein
MTGIWEFPDLNLLEEFIIDGIEAERQELIQEGQQALEQLRYGDIIVAGEWGNGTGEIGEDPLELKVIFGTVEEERTSTNQEIAGLVGGMIQEFLGNLSEGNVDVPDVITEWFSYIEISPVPDDLRQDGIIVEINDRRGNSVYNLSRKERISFEPDVPFEELPRTSQQALVREQQPSPEPEPDLDDEQTDEEVEEEIEEEDEPETIVDYIERINQNDDGKLKVPALNKIKTVELREPYEFEYVTIAPSRPATADLLGLDSPIDVPSSITQLRDELYVNSDLMFIGKAIAGDLLGGQVPAGTFPRTGVYIRNRLKYVGVGYGYEIYKDLVYYTGLIQQVHGYNLSVPRYNSFNEYLYVIREITDMEDGPDLINALSQQQAAARGLETIPDHPSIEGEKAPWLEPRQYYDIVEENEDHGAWADPYTYLHGDDEDDDQNADDGG